MTALHRIGIGVLWAAAWLGGSTAVGAAGRPASRSGPAGLRLDGTFIQYQPWMMELDRQAWRRELESLRRAGLKTIVIQWLAHNDRSFLPEQKEAVDPTELILDYADGRGMEVFVGLFMDDAWWEWTPQAGLPERLARSTRSTAEQAWKRYGRHRSFAGWYLPPEPADSIAPESIPAVRAFFRETTELCDRLSGGKPVAFSPFLTGQVEPAEVERRYAELLDGSGVDILMLQDGVGARRWDEQVHTRVAPLFRAMRDACLAAGVDLWSDVEIFRDDSNDPAKPRFRPSDTTRLARQLAAEAPFVSRFIAFDCFHYMSPHRGEAQRRFHEAYVRDFVDRPFYPLLGPGVILDPSFAYYRDRSPESIAAEIRANGYSVVHCITEPSSRVDRKLVDAFHAAGLGAWLQVFGNGTYFKQFLPEGWQAWRMVTRTDLSGGQLPGFQRLCLNSKGYRDWRKKDLAAALKAAPFDGIEIAESHWPEYPGVKSPAYACFCDACRQAFASMFPEESALPDVLDDASPRSPANAPKLWEKWLRFREASLVGFLDDLVNGPGGLRETSPGVTVAVWGLALDEPNGVARVREDSGQDAGRAAAVVKPDLYCFQTHWPDWLRGDLPPDYVNRYQPFIDQLREHAPTLPLMIQTDIGSERKMIRDRGWIESFERSCRGMGVETTCLYEYFIGGWTYREPPHAVFARHVGNELELCFTRRLDPASASGAFHIDDRPAKPLRLDGCRVWLPIPAGNRRGPWTVKAAGLKVEANRMLFQDLPIGPSPEQTLRVQRLR